MMGSGKVSSQGRLHRDQNGGVREPTVQGPWDRSVLDVSKDNKGLVCLEWRVPTREEDLWARVGTLTLTLGDLKALEVWSSQTFSRIPVTVVLRIDVGPGQEEVRTITGERLWVGQGT